MKCMRICFLFSLRVSSLIALFSLYVLFSQYRSSDNTLENCFSQISSYSRAYLRVIYEKTKSQVPPDPYWENNKYKLKRSIMTSEVSFEKTRGRQNTPRTRATSRDSPKWSGKLPTYPNLVTQVYRVFFIAFRLSYVAMKIFLFPTQGLPWLIVVSSSFSCCSRRHIRRNLHQSQGCHTSAVWSSYLDSFQGKTLVTKQCRQTIQSCAAPSLYFHGYNITPWFASSFSKPRIGQDRRTSVSCTALLKGIRVDSLLKRGLH